MAQTDIPRFPVLLVDDEPQILRSASVWLRTSGIAHVVILEDGRAVWPLLAEQDVGVVVLDLTMPYLSGQVLLEHNYEWSRILDNAVSSFTERMVLILFTPERATTEEIAFRPDIGVPDIAFRLADITDRFPPDMTYSVQRIPSATQYGYETILLLERHQGV